MPCAGVKCPATTIPDLSIDHAEREAVETPDSSRLAGVCAGSTLLEVRQSAPDGHLLYNTILIAAEVMHAQTCKTFARVVL